MEWKPISRTSTNSWWSMSKVVASGSWASWSRPKNTSWYIRATRAGVSCRPSRSGSSPIAARISRTAACTRGWSTGMSDSRPARATLARGPGDLGVVPTRVGQLGRIGLHRLARVVLLRAGGGGGAAHLRRLERGPLAAGGPHLAQRTLPDVGEDLGQVVLVQGLPLEQLGDQAIEHVPVLHDHRPGLVQGVVEQSPHLLVDEGGCLGAEAGCLTLLHAHEDLVLVAGQRDLAHGGGHPQLHDHGAGDLRGLLQVVAGAGGDVVEDALLHGVARSEERR